MSELESWILSYLLNSLWQVPLLFAAGWLAAHILRSAGTVVEHRVWVVVLFLQSVLPACSLLPWEWLQTLTFWSHHANRPGEAHVTVVLGSGTGFGELPLPGPVLTTVAILYISFTTYFTARFLWRSFALSSLRREAVPLDLSAQAANFWARCLKQFALDHVSIAAAARISGPVTMGVQQKLVLLPLGMIETLPEKDLQTVIAHECMHMHRHDFLKNLLYELLSLPIAYHPLLWLTRTRIMETREMICDEMAAGIHGQKEYARSLLRLARLLVEGPAAVTPHTIGIFDANVFERRIMNLSEDRIEVRGLRRMTLVAASAVLGLGISASAMAIAMHVNPAAASQNDTAAQAPKQLSVSAKIMSGNLLNKAVPVYPPDAKKAKIEGAVVLSAIISRDGNVEKLRVLSGPRLLQQSALDAVRQWKYKPYLLNGDPVEVRTTIHIIYNLKG